MRRKKQKLFALIFGNFSLFQCYSHNIFVAVNQMNMIRQLINKVFSPEKQFVSDALSDIGIIYNYIQQNGEIYGEWYFQNVFILKYWNFLKYYTWLSSRDQDHLVCGCLNIILFLNHRYLLKDEKFIEAYFPEINSMINDFTPMTWKHKKLYYMVKEALLMTGKKINGLGYEDRRDNIYQSISWTLKNTILDSTTKPTRSQKPWSGGPGLFQKNTKTLSKKQ